MPPGSSPPGAALAVVGESLVDIVVAPAGRRTISPGGSPMNVAVGLARLGVPTELLTRLGDDADGRLVADHLRSSGVALSASSVDAGTPTSTAVARLGPDNAASYDFDLSWDLPVQRLPDATALHVGSLGALLRPGSSTVLELVHQASGRGMQVSYDPNIRPAFVDEPVTAWREVVELASVCSLVKVSDEDLDVLRPGEPPVEVARQLLTGGRTELVILTCGSAGSIGVTPEATVRAAVPEADVVDTVGAGDSFMAAVLAVLWEQDRLRAPGGPKLNADDLRSLLAAAGAAAAVTCSRSGADPPWREELPAGWPAAAVPDPPHHS